MAMKPTALMSHSVLLTLSTRRTNLYGSSHSFSHSFALFTFLDRQETQQENNFFPGLMGSPCVPPPALEYRCAEQLKKGL